MAREASMDSSGCSPITSSRGACWLPGRYAWAGGFPPLAGPGRLRIPRVPAGQSGPGSASSTEPCVRMPAPAPTM